MYVPCDSASPVQPGFPVDDRCSHKVHDVLLFNAAIPQSLHLDVLTCGSLPGIAEELSEEDGSDLLAPCKDPVWTMQSVLKALARANTSQRVDLDWQAQNKVPAAAYSRPYNLHTSGTVSRQRTS